MFHNIPVCLTLIVMVTHVLCQNTVKESVPKSANSSTINQPVNMAKETNRIFEAAAVDYFKGKPGITMAPTLNGDAVHVHIELFLITVMELDDLKQILTTGMLFAIYWTDEMLRCENESICSIDYFLPIDRKDIWMPDLFVANAYEHESFVSEAKYVEVWPGAGMVRVQGTRILKTMCPLDFNDYPYDDQECIIYLAWYSNMTLSPTISTHQTDSEIDRIFVNFAWDLFNQTTDTCVLFNETYQCVKLSLRRKTTFYTVCLVVPMVLTSFMNTLVFLVPLQSGEKVSFLVTIFVSTSVFVGFFKDLMPRNITRLPLVMKMLISVVAQSVLVLVATFIVSSLYNKERAATSTKSTEPESTDGIDSRCLANTSCSALPKARNKTHPTKPEEHEKEPPHRGGYEAREIRERFRITSQALNLMFFLLSLFFSVALTCWVTY